MAKGNGGVYFTKKQKIQMRERKRRKLLAKKKQQHDGDDNDNQDTSVINQEEEKDITMTSHDNDVEIVEMKSNKVKEIRIEIPSHLTTGKEIRKFRKDERRKIRKQYADESIPIIFVDKNNEKQTKKKQQFSFPNLNQLVQQQQQKESSTTTTNQQKKVSSDVIPQSIKNQFIAMDCEMVGIGTDGIKSALARVSLVDWDGNIILDTHVKVPVRVTDFRTHVSGILPRHLRSKNGAIELDECRTLVARLLENKILVGHGLANDLQCLWLQRTFTKKWANIRDTAHFTPYQRLLGNQNKWRPRKLRDLAKDFLGRTIQGAEHDSVQDARAAMDLYKLYHVEWEAKVREEQKRDEQRRGKKRRRQIQTEEEDDDDE